MVGIVIVVIDGNVERIDGCCFEVVNCYFWSDCVFGEGGLVECNIVYG